MTAAAHILGVALAAGFRFRIQRDKVRVTRPPTALERMIQDLRARRGEIRAILAAANEPSQGRHMEGQSAAQQGRERLARPVNRALPE